MKKFSQHLYELWGANNLYGRGLKEHLRGLDLAGLDYSRTSGTYQVIFSWLVLTVLVFWALYYFVNRKPRFSRRSTWGLVMLGVVLLNCVIGFYIPWKALNTGMFASSIISFSTADIVFFSLTNGFWAAILFLIFTFLIKIKPLGALSPNRHTPFKQ